MREIYYTLNELAMFTGLTTRTLRNYLKMNVLSGGKAKHSGEDAVMEILKEYYQ